MSDARWDDPRGERDRDDGRPRVYDDRDRDDHDPRDGPMHDLDLPRGDPRRSRASRRCGARRLPSMALLEWRRVQQARWLKKGQENAALVFPSRQGPALEEHRVRHVFKRMLEKAKLRHIRIHDLRDTFASLLLQQGESVVYVKEQLGHGSIQITVDTYGHLIPGANRGAVNRLDDVDATQPDATQAHLMHSSMTSTCSMTLTC